MDIEIIQYEPIHALDIFERNIKENDAQLSRYPNWDETVKGWKLHGPAFTLVVDDQIVGCAGVTLNKHIGEAWTLFSSLFYKHSRLVYKTIKEYLNNIAKEHQLKRIQAYVDPIRSLEVCDRFLIHLGFKLETPDGLENFGPVGQTLYLYGRTYKWIQ
jgi:hypothetical protein